MFTETKQETASLSEKVPKTLKDRADLVAKEIKAVDPTLSFNASRILHDAYEGAVIAAEQELAALRKV